MPEISNLPPADPPSGSEELPVVQGGITKRMASVDVARALPPATPSAQGAMSTADKAKLDGIQAGATANASDAQLRDRATHTGTQAISTVDGLQAALDGKAPVVHTHVPGDITGLNTAIYLKVREIIQPGANVTKTPNDVAEQITLGATGGGGGGGANWGEIGGLIGNQADLASALAGKSDTSHGHSNASTSAAGFMSAADKTKLDGVATGATATPLASTTPAAVGAADVGVAASAARADHVHAHGNQAGGSLHANATTSVAGFMSSGDKTKLDGIATGATANATDAQLRDRATHTGSQAISTVTGLQAALDAKANSASPVFTGPVTVSGVDVTAPFVMGGGTAIDVTRRLNFKEISADTTLTFSAVPSTNAWFMLRVANASGADRVVTIPSSFSLARQANITTVTVPAGGQLLLMFHYTGSVYILAGDGGARNNLVAATAPGTGNDNTQGYAVGSMWVDTVANRVYFCTNASTGSAVWWGGSAGGGSWGSITGTLSDQTDLQAALNAKAGLIPVIEVVSGTSRTLTAGDNGKILVFTNTGAISVTVNTDFNGRGVVLAWAASAGTITVNLTGVTVNGGSSALVLSQGLGSLNLIPVGTNAFLGVGSIGELTAADISDSTANGRAILTAADYAAMRTLLGLVVGTDVAAQSHVGSGGTAHANATTSVAGFLSAADKTKLDSLPAQGATREITGAATLGTADVNVTVRFNSGSTAALTVPSDSTLGVTPGKATLAVFIQGTGVPTFTGSGATILGSPRSGLAQNDTIVLNHTGIANTWSYA
jgi:hypothetical protein